MADSKNVPFLSFRPFLAEKMALEVKKARFNPFVLPSDFFKADGDPVYSKTKPVKSGTRQIPLWKESLLPLPAWGIEATGCPAQVSQKERKI